VSAVHLTSQGRWPNELTQRLILERLLLIEIRPVPARNPPEPGTWPLTEPRPAAEGYLPEYGALSVAGAV
jgi:hypothetical protein